MTNTVWVYVIALIGGVAVAIQAQMMGILDRGIGTLESVLITYGAGGLLIGLIMVALKGGNLSQWQSVPGYALFAGVIGLVIVASIGYTVPRLGMVTAFTLLIAAQFAVGALFDQFGWLGAEVRELNVSRIAGLFIMLFGVWMVLKK